MRKPKMKTNWIKRLEAFLLRRTNAEHVAEVVVYVDGRVVEQKSVIFCEEYGKSALYAALSFANGVVSAAFGLERRRMKGRA